ERSLCSFPFRPPTDALISVAIGFDAPASRQPKLSVANLVASAFPNPAIGDIAGLHFCPKSFSFGPAAHVAFSLTIRFGNVNSCSMTISELDFQRMQARIALNTKSDPLNVQPVESEKQLHSDILLECRSRGWIAIHSRLDRPSTTAIGSPVFVICADRGPVI